MTTPFRGALAAALVAHVAAVPLMASAQTAPRPQAAKPAPYVSAFDGYRRFGDQKVQPWREANDNVGRIGGWQAYAREAASDDAAPMPQAPAASTPGQAPAPARSPAPANPASTPHDAHKGHGGHSMHKKP
ncbi:hypothetical protein LRS03_05240 [Rhizobacter sp. J219]|uniref:hypothetical protein n=1 Tax=Rhizobacter sp. J219 TaxID=2898430 RepID=UPI00215090A0|nr:hypothetical protein [Rhizobacter sp. J219]MCR5882294.1 hypothetical protein [Rhizobacter sp. J219]